MLHAIETGVDLQFLNKIANRACHVRFGHAFGVDSDRSGNFQQMDEAGFELNRNQTSAVLRQLTGTYLKRFYLMDVCPLGHERDHAEPGYLIVKLIVRPREKHLPFR